MFKKEMLSRKNLKRSFTLIEFLVVIAIIGVLAALAMTTMTQGRAKARDARRLADTASLKKALEMYFLDNADYPNNSQTEIGGCLEEGAIHDFLAPLLTPKYLGRLPQDPSYPKQCYFYATGSDYVIIANFEQNPELEKNDGGNLDNYYETFSSKTALSEIYISDDNNDGTPNDTTTALAQAMGGEGGGGSGGGGTANTWLKTLSGTNEDYGWSIQQTSDGGYILTGETDSFGAGDADVLVVKLNSNAQVTWAKTLGGTDREGSYSVQQTSDGGYILTGKTYTSSGDVLVVKLDEGGEVTWAKTLGGTSYDYGYSIQQTSDGYILTGRAYSFGAGDGDVLVVKLDNQGNVSDCSSYLIDQPSLNAIDQPSLNANSYCPSQP